MAKKNSNVISVGEFEEAVKNLPRTEIVEWNGLNVEVKYAISAEEMMLAVESIIAWVFADPDDFHPELADFAFRNNIIDRYTNIRMPVSNIKKYDMLYGTDVFDVVYEHINQHQADQIHMSSKRKIDYVANAGVAAVRSGINKVVEDIGSLGQGFADLFANVDANDLSALTDFASKIANIDEVEVAHNLLKVNAEGSDE